MGKTINLRRYRRRKAAEKSKRRAAADRARAALTPHERARLSREAARRARLLEGARLEPKEDGRD